ncbi:hypothetical protein PGT21_024218 [Puccinia graminis f. sp. tritici]|uniref:Uncharacterized protein n=1 Tax=Puccinia graminis f. sp. tritici TaxID=56615 RepID=A0A5B0MM19_PUCGR|nr:hypothetical protein PGT21_024218 [Puccinia graminis f. sp. tritici]
MSLDGPNGFRPHRHPDERNALLIRLQCSVGRDKSLLIKRLDRQRISSSIKVRGNLKNARHDLELKDEPKGLQTYQTLFIQSYEKERNYINPTKNSE